jgi:hypothetical protein
MLNDLINTYDLTPIDLTFGPLNDHEVITIYENIYLRKEIFQSKHEYYDAKLIKADLKTSMYVTVSGINQNSPEGIEFRTFVGIQDRLKINEPFADSPLVDTVDFEEFDVYYIVVLLKYFEDYNLTFNFYLSNDERDLNKLFKILIIVAGILLGVCFFCCITFFCCSQRNEEGKEKKQNKCIHNCCVILTCGFYKNKRKQKYNTNNMYVRSEEHIVVHRTQNGNGYNSQPQARRDNSLNVTRDRDPVLQSNRNVNENPSRYNPEIL